MVNILHPLTIIVLLTLMGCASTAAPRQSNSANESAPITSIASGGNIETSSKSLTPTIAFERPQVTGLIAEEMWLPDTIRSSISRNFTNFARGYITVINIADDSTRAAEIERSLSGPNDELSLVARTAARAIMTGKIIKRSGNRFDLELIITETETSAVLASHSNTYSDAEQAVRRATEDLLTQLGLKLSDAGRQRLYQTSSEADIALARGLNAERERQSLQAMNYLFNAQNFSSTASQAAASLAVVQTTQQSLAGAGATVIDHFARQDFFQRRLNEYNAFYDSHAPFELFYTEPKAINMKGIRTDTTDTRQFDLSFKVGLRWSNDQINVMEKVLNDYILTHLNKIPAAQRSNLELRGLPEDARLFKGPDNFKYILTISVENENGVQITSGLLDLSASLFYHNGRIFARCTQEKDAVLPNIKYIENQFRELYVVITSINGVDVRSVGESGFMRLVQVQGADLPPPNRDNLPWQITSRLSSDVARSAAEERKIIREQKEEERKTARAQKMANHPMNNPYVGYGFNGGWTLGTDAKLLDIDLVFGYKSISGKIGFLSYPGLQKEKMEEYFGTVNETSTMGVDFGGFYSFLNPKWHLSLGGGIALFNVSESKKAVVPHFQTMFYWNFLNIGFISAGYRGDFYPGNYVDFFSSSPANAGPLPSIFWGHNLLFGVLILPFSGKMQW